MDPLTNREQAKLQAEIARQEKQEKLAGQQKLLREGHVQKQHRRQQEMLRYQLSSSEWLAQVKPAPTFYPTVEQFKDPIAYIRSIQAEGSQHGICKIVPPVLPSVPSGLVLDKPEGSKLTFSTREQLVEQLTWENFDTARFWDSGKVYSIKDYERFADDFQRRRFGLAGCLPAKLVEADYWRQVSSPDNPVVEYGNDVEGTAFCAPDQQDPLGSSSWNLQILPHVKHSTLRLLRGDAPGVSSPMLYIGMLFATFAWHVEDHYLYSINYQHLGAAKTWYGVPGSDADSFEAVVRQHVYKQAAAAAAAEGKSEAEVAAAVHTALLGKTTMFSPELLLNAGVHVSRAVQAPGEYIITFPRAYHGGFSNGFCIGEAVNFSIADWFPFGLEAANRYRRLGRLPVLAHDELLCLEGLAVHEQLQQGGQDWHEHPQADLHIVLMRCFVHIIREQHLQRAQLLLRGLSHVQHLPFSASMPCCRCKGMMYIAEVVSGDDWTVPLCLACALAQPPASQCPLKIRVQSNIAELESVAMRFEELLRQPIPESSAGGCKTHGLDLTGLTEVANFGLPEGSLDTGSPQDVFHWSALPVPMTSCSAPDTKKEEEQQQQDDSTVGDRQTPTQDLGAYEEPPEELIRCQRDAPEPLAKPTPAKSGKARGVRGPVHGVKGPTHRPTPSKGTSMKASSSSGQRAHSTSNEEVLPLDGPASEPEHAHAHRSNPSHDSDTQPSGQPLPRAATPSYPPGASQNVQVAPPNLRINKPTAAQKEQPVVARRQSQRTPRKRTFSSDDEDDAAGGEAQQGSQWQAPHRHGHDRQESRMANSGVADHHERHHAAGRSQDDAEAGRGYSDRPRAPGKRPTVKWSKLGSDAESPPDKRTKVQVPGVKAANGAYIPPGPMLNTAATRLACLEDTEVNVSGPGGPRRLFRRRIFAPEEDREERYLTASDVVKGSGFETNTSASNIIDRWTREACSIIVRHNQRNNTNLPMPELPARAFCAGMASSCYVLKAVDVEMLMLPGVLKDDLRANLQRYIANVWPRFALPLPHQIPAAHPRSHAASKPLSRPASAQPLANPPTHHSKRKRSAPRGYNDPDPQQHQEDDPEDYQPQRRPSSANPTWPRHSRAVRSGPGAGRKGPGEMHAEHSRDYGGNAATSSQSVDDTPASSRLQRVLRSRGGRGKSAEQAAALRVANWGAAGQVQGSDSQGLDVLAGLAESALTEQQRAEEEERAPPVNMKPKPHRQKSAAATGHLVANDHQAFDTDSFSQRQHPGIQPYSRQAFGAGPSQLMPPGPSHATALGHPQSAAFRQLSHAPLASEHMQSADLPLSSQLPPHRQMHLGQSQSQPFSTRLPFGQAPKPTQDAPASVLWRSTGPDNIIRPQAIRSTGFALPSFSQPQQVSVAALHSKLSPGSPTSVIQRAVQGPQGTAQHPLDPSPPSTDSAPAAPDQQTGHVSSAVHDGEPAVVNAHGGIAVGKSQDAAYPEAQPHQTHAEPNWGSSEGTNQAGLTSYATQLKPEQGNPSQGQTHQGSAATAPAPTSAPAAAAMPQPQISTTEASAPSSSLPAASASTASAAQQQEHFSLSSIDKLPAAAQQPQGTASAITHALPMLPEGPMASTGVNAAESISQGLSAQHQPPAPNGPALEMQPTHGAGSTDTRQHSQAANAAVQNGVIKPEPGSGLPVGSHGYQPSQSILHAAAACAPQPSPSWSVHQLPHGQWVCVMRDGATLTLAQLYYTLESVGRTLPQDRLHALGMMIEQLTRLGEKCLPPPQKAS